MIVATGDVKFLADSQLTLRPGARLTLYCAHVLVVQDRAKVNIGGDPGKLLIHYSGTSRIEIKSSSAFCGTLRAPLSEVKVKDLSNFYGWCYSYRFISDNHAKVHCDSANSTRAEWIEGR